MSSDDEDTVPQPKRGSRTEDTDENDFEPTNQRRLALTHEHDQSQSSQNSSQIGDDFDEEQFFAQNNWHFDAGAIEYIKMTNFMCHAKFDYYPNQRINFITGVNGSGKSAVMSALIFGLGGSAKMTNRGNANRNLIRTGQATASVEISLLNQGENAYRPVSILRKHL